MMDCVRRHLLTVLCGIAVFAIALPAASTFAQDSGQAQTAAPAPTASQETKKILDKPEIERRLRQCAEIVSKVERLICFNELTRALGIIGDEQAEREEKILEKYGFWTVSRKKTVTAEEVYYLKNDAVEEAKLQSGMKRIPTFVIMCKHGRTDAYLDWKSRMASYYLGGFSKLQILYQFDAGAKTQATWELSTDRQAAFIPDPIAFIKEMKGHEKMFLYFTPMGESAQTSIFDISGLEAVLGILVKECYN